MGPTSPALLKWWMPCSIRGLFNGKSSATKTRSHEKRRLRFQVSGPQRSRVLGSKVQDCGFCHSLVPKLYLRTQIHLKYDIIYWTSLLLVAGAIGLIEDKSSWNLKKVYKWELDIATKRRKKHKNKISGLVNSVCYN